MENPTRKHLIFMALILIVASIGCVSNSDDSGDTGTQEQTDGVQIVSTPAPPPRVPVKTTEAPTTPPPATTEAPTNEPWYEDLSPNLIKAKSQRITYQTLVRENEEYSESVINFKGKVTRIWGSYDAPYNLTLMTKANDNGVYYDEAIYITGYYLEPRLLKNDIINFYGVPDGFVTYSEKGVESTVPNLIPLHAIV